MASSREDDGRREEQLSLAGHVATAVLLAKSLSRVRLQYQGGAGACLANPLGSWPRLGCTDSTAPGAALEESGSPVSPRRLRPASRLVLSSIWGRELLASAHRTVLLALVRVERIAPDSLDRFHVAIGPMSKRLTAFGVVGSHWWLVQETYK